MNQDRIADRIAMADRIAEDAGESVQKLDSHYDARIYPDGMIGIRDRRNSKWVVLMEPATAKKLKKLI